MLSIESCLGMMDSKRTWDTAILLIIAFELVLK